MAPGPASALNIFISYAHEDEALRQELETALAPLKAALDVWHDRRISPGAYWNSEIESHFDAAQIILLLVSADFFASQYCNELELPRALKMHDDGKATVVPVIVREVAWEDSPLHRFQASPKDAKPVTSWTNRDAAWKDVVEAIRRLIPGMNSAPAATASAGDSAKQGMQALAQLMDTGEVREAVATFRAEFEVSRSQIEVMGDYKDLHDQLHFLKVNCYDCIVLESSRFPDDELAKENLSRYLDDVQHIADNIAGIAGRKSVEAEAGRIQAKLAQALKMLGPALEKLDGKGLRGAVVLLGRLLAWDPVLINRQLNAAAKALRLAELQSAMHRTAATVAHLNLDAAQIARFGDGVAALDALAAGLVALIAGHDRWQRVDGDLSMIESAGEGLTDELRAAWPAMRPEVAALSTPATEKWATDLAGTSDKLDAALTRDDPAAITQQFRQYRRRASLRFYTVDETLKKQCDELRKLGEPMDLILGMIK